MISAALSFLTPERANLMLLSPQHEGLCPLREKWFGTHYNMEGERECVCYIMTLTLILTLTVCKGLYIVCHMWYISWTQMQENADRIKGTNIIFI